MTDFSPMLAIASTGASGRHPVSIESLAGTHVYDLKLDGLRCWVRRVGFEVTLYNRNGVDITRKFPEIHAAFLASAPFELIDGEIVAEDGKFETALTRDKQEHQRSIDTMSVSHPCRYVAFDIPSENLRKLAWTTRREVLEFWYEGKVDPRISLSPYSEDPAFFAQVAALGMEGVIAKRKAAPYQMGKRSKDFVKFKRVFRISCLVAGYNTGNGSREHFGALRLALHDHGTLVDLGTVGSGFTVRQTHELKARLDAGEVIVAEIEAANISSGGLLRFPVFVDIRLDVDPLDCTTDQLATLPRC